MGELAPDAPAPPAPADAPAPERTSSAPDQQEPAREAEEEAPPERDPGPVGVESGPVDAERESPPEPVPAALGEAALGGAEVEAPPEPGDVPPAGAAEQPGSGPTNAADANDGSAVPLDAEASPPSEPADAETAEPESRDAQIEALRDEVDAIYDQQERVAAARDEVDQAHAGAEVPMGPPSDGPTEAPGGPGADGVSDAGAPADRVPTGDPRLEAVWDASTDTPAGRAFFEETDPVLPLAKEVQPMEGVYTADLHGDPEGMVAPSADGPVQLSAGDLADIIRSDPDWDGQPVRLLSCDTGLPPGPERDAVAQQLADDLGVPVLAPEDKASSDWNGNVWAEGTDAFGAPKPVASAQWPTFYPR